MKDPLIKYLLNSKGYASVMKGVPLEYMENAKDLTSEVQQDKYLDEQTKSDLIEYFKTKVEEECDFKP